MNPEKTLRGVFLKAKATGKDGIRYYCDDPILHKWRAEGWLDGSFAVGWGTDPASAREDLVNLIRQRSVTA